MKIDITQIKLVCPHNCSPFEERVAQIFCEEVALRAGLEVERTAEPPVSGSYLLIRRMDLLKKHHPRAYARIAQLEPPGAEGFCLSVTTQGADLQIIVAGADDRGCLYGMARVLRKLELRSGEIHTTRELRDMSVTPRYPLRGHQLAYRDKQNTCPSWDVAEFDRYIRDLALFGSNAIEILPPRTDDAGYSAHFRRDPFEMMVSLSRVIHSYGMDVWLWYPNMGLDYSDAATVEQELRERERIYARIPYLDAVLIPAGDPGLLMPQAFFPVVEAGVRVLHQYHPHARVWVAPQVFHPQPGWYADFYSEVNKQPPWLYGVCFAPWVMDTVQEMQAKLPDIYKNRIRHYPDITHNSHSQFELADWDMALALTQGREGYNARPAAMKQIHNLHAPFTIGSLTYSEGIHDDVNKMVWGDQDFDPDMPVEETLRDYVRLFIDPAFTQEMAALLLQTEQSWIGPLAQNSNVDAVYEGFLALEQKAGAGVRGNFRFQMALERAVSDYQIKLRAVHDTALEREALAVLSRAKEQGSVQAIREARRLLRNTFDEPVGLEQRKKIQQLADSLREGCGIRLTTRRHGAQSWIRGASLDSLDTPLNDSRWYLAQLAGIAALAGEEERLAEVSRLLSRCNPGEGGFYDWLGDPESFHRRVVQEKSWGEDPGYLRSPVLCHDPYGIQWLMHRMEGWYDEFPITLRWVGRARTLYGTPLQLRYSGLDPKAHYQIRVAYPDLLTAEPGTVYELQLWAGESLLHDCLTPHAKEQNPIRTFALPPEAYRDGDLRLTWQMKGTLYPVSVSEIWIVKE